MKYAIGIEYQGSVANGWQSQLDSQSSVQLYLTQALSKVANHSIKVAGSGRTDSGVHALMQVAHFSSTANRLPEQWLKGANSNLPNGIKITWCQTVGDDFHARFYAEQRTYAYVIYNHSTPAPFWINNALWYPYKQLCVMQLQELAQILVGTYDFSSFRSSRCQAKSPIKELKQISVERTGKLVIITLTANSFLQRMVRIIVGTLMDLHAKLEHSQAMLKLKYILEQMDRKIAPDTVTANGLYYLGPIYAQDFKLPSPQSFFSALGIESTPTSIICK